MSVSWSSAGSFLEEVDEELDEVSLCFVVPFTTSRNLLKLFLSGWGWFLWGKTQHCIFFGQCPRKRRRPIKVFWLLPITTPGNGPTFRVLIWFPHFGVCSWNSWQCWKVIPFHFEFRSWRGLCRRICNTWRGPWRDIPKFNFWKWQSIIFRVFRFNLAWRNSDSTRRWLWHVVLVTTVVWGTHIPTSAVSILTTVTTARVIAASSSWITSSTWGHITHRIASIIGTPTARSQTSSTLSSPTWRNKKEFLAF